MRISWGRCSLAATSLPPDSLFRGDKAEESVRGGNTVMRSSGAFAAASPEGVVRPEDEEEEAADDCAAAAESLA
ncbi:hypothetical protein cyc_02962 [Cyclospora cayetanensis]|uniref:Uncharacterized protein n=1 Tax=Cyclospora cayetanensis TaxID=88456 RepID=A0A1D3DAA8_9EIME|nr:hypothetical protein cyc_02962 [Cyclospora cayetanensis]